MKNRSLCYRCGKYWLDLNTDEDLDPAVEYMSEREYLELPDKAREAWDNGEDDWERFLDPDYEEDEETLPDPPAEIVIPDSVTICQAIAFDSMI